MSIDIKGLYNTIVHQLSAFWKVDDVDEKMLLAQIEHAAKLTYVGYEKSAKSYYKTIGFSELNSSVYTVFLSHLAHLVGNSAGGGTVLADKIYYLNKMMNGMEVYWNVNLPKHFIVDHPLGTVLGRAEYGDYLSVYQGVTVGGNVAKNGEWVFPKLGNYVTMYAHSSVLGNSIIGDYVIFSANSYVINRTIPVLFSGSHQT